MVLHSVATFAAIESISAIIVAVPAGYEDEMEQLLRAPEPWRVAIRVVTGGAERQDSVAAALAIVDSTAELVLVHDAARPFVRTTQILACIAAAAECGGAILALPANDTIKVATDDGMVGETIDRRRIWLAQTPQVFRRTLLQAAYASLRDEPVAVTDDAMLIERCGGKLRLVAGDPDNRKITNPADLEWAEWYCGRLAPPPPG